MARAGRTARPGKPSDGKALAADGFWHKPVLMNLVSDLLLVVGSAALAWATVALVQRLPWFPLREVIVASPMEQVSRGQVEHIAKTALAGNFFTVDLDAVRLSFERLPWVRRAEVRRVWPDGLELALEEHVAVARWQHAEGEPTLVNTHGEVFVALAPANARLPAFTGPEGSAARVLARYREVEQALAPIGRKTAAIVLSSREAWEVKLDDGVVVALGRDQTKATLGERLARFTDHYPTVRERLRGGVAVVDMRYPNGFALRLGRSERNG